MDPYAQKPLKQRIGDLLKISELTFGDHHKWPLYRKFLLDELNAIRRITKTSYLTEEATNDSRSNEHEDL